MVLPLLGGGSPNTSNDSNQDSATNTNILNDHCHVLTATVAGGSAKKMNGEETPKKLSKNAKRKLKYKQQKSENAAERQLKCDDVLTINGAIKNISIEYTIKKAGMHRTPSNSSNRTSSNKDPKNTPPKFNLDKRKNNSFCSTSPKKSPDNNTNENLYPEYWSDSMIETGLADSQLLTGVIRINKSNYRHAYVTHPDGGIDILIDGMLARNRSLEGDVVVIKLLPSLDVQRRGEVVYIKSQEHPRTCIGTIQNFNKNHKYILFVPRDSRFPRLQIYRTDWPDCLLQGNVDDVDKIVYYAKLTVWPSPKSAVGAIIKEVGKSGDIEVETKSILLENDLDGTPHGPEMDAYYPSSPFTIPEAEIENRLDCRNKCIFTIDPLTARDLDDALSCEELPNGNFKIGVHISDVSYFLKPNTPLDEAVAFKATSVYMVESVYHMLPKALCMMCSLLPGKDRLAFSVFWEMTPEAEIISTSFHKTVINTCTQLAYEHAQKIIDGADLIENDFPEVLHNYNLDYLSRIVNQLQSLAVAMRTKRFANGSLRIDQPKLCFRLNPTTCLPESFEVYKIRDSNRLIEEFMLLANITVATHLYANLPQSAFLRAHPAPQARMLKELQELMKTVDVSLDVESSKSMQRSLWELEEKLHSIDSENVMIVVNNLCSRAMTRAHYFCVKQHTEEDDLRHYALSVDRYTHFTSPIRRYADVIVHRQLAHVMGIEEYQHECKELDLVASQCNKNKFNAKRAGEMSCDLYLNYYITARSPLVESAIICDIKDRSFDIVVISMNLNKRIYYESLLHARYEPIFNQSRKKVIELKIQWDERVPRETYVHEYAKKSAGKTPFKLRKHSQNETEINETNIPNSGTDQVGFVTLKMFSKVKIVLCGTPEDPQNVEVYLLPSI